MKKKKKLIIVKVQIPIITNEPYPKVLVYNQTRTVENMFPYTKELRRLLKGELKSFWYAEMIPNKKPRGTFTVSLGKPVPWQRW